MDGLYLDMTGYGAFGQIYVYNDGIVSFGRPLPSTAAVGDPASLGNSYAAPGFADLGGSLGGIAAFSYFMSDGTGVDASGNPNVVVAGVDIFWILNSGSIFGVSVSADCGSLACFEYGSGPGSWYSGSGTDPYLPAGAMIGFPGDHVTMPSGDPVAFLDGGSPAFQHTVDLAGAPPAPEPAAWALMLVGFAGLGATLRSRRKAAQGRTTARLGLSG